MTDIGYKFLTADGRSLSNEHGAVMYRLDGEWTEVIGHGAYIALTVSGLLRGGFGPLLAEVEYDQPTGQVDDGHVITAHSVRVLRTATVDLWLLVRVVIYAAKQVSYLSTDPRVEAAIVAAETCTRARTPRAAKAAAKAAKAAWAATAAAATAAAWAATAAAWAAAAEAKAAAWAAKAAAKAAAVAEATAAAAEVAEVAEDAAETAYDTDILRKFVRQAFGKA